MCRSRRELSNAYFLAKFGFDTAENEPCKVCPLCAYRSPRCAESRCAEDGRRRLHPVRGRQCTPKFNPSIPEDKLIWIVSILNFLVFFCAMLQRGRKNGEMFVNGNSQYHCWLDLLEAFEHRNIMRAKIISKSEYWVNLLRTFEHRNIMLAKTSVNLIIGLIY